MPSHLSPQTPPDAGKQPSQTIRNTRRFLRAMSPVILALVCGFVATQPASAQWCRDGNTPTLGACGGLNQRICVVDSWWNASNCPSQCQAPYSLRWGVCRAACPGKEIAGVCCGDLGEIACITSPSCAQGLSVANPLLYDPAYLANCVPSPSPEQTPLNGSTARPFYIWGHNPNSAGKIDSDLAAGANALEPDITLAADAPCAGTDASIADLVMEDSSSPYRTGLCSDTHLVDWLKYVSSKASLADSKLALIAFDIKSSVADAKHVKSILTAIRTYLTPNVKNLNVILSVGSTADAKKAFGDGTETAWAGIRAAELGPREGVMIDGEDNVLDVFNFFQPIPNNYGNFGYGDGTALNAADVSFSGVQPRALDRGAFLRSSYGFPKIVSYAYLLNAKAEMHSYINAGVDGIIPGSITSVLPAPDGICQTYYSNKLAIIPLGTSDYLTNAKYQLACLTSPLTDPDLDVSQIKNLVSVVSSHPEIRLATRDDNPFQPKLQSYALEVTTPANSGLSGYGTNANLKFTLNGCKGTADMTVNSGFIIPPFYTSGRMEGGQTDHVTIPSADLGTLASITIYNDGTGVGPDWTFKDLKVSSTGYIGPNLTHNQEYQALGTTALAAFKTVTLPLTANFPGGGSFSAPSLPDVIAQCSAPLPAAPVATQSCTAGNITGATDAKGPFGQGDTQIVWTFTDAAGNKKTRTQAVHVHDTIPPVADAASLPNVVAQCSAKLPAPPTATDACSGKIIGTNTSPATFGQGDFTATWKFTDAQSNQSSQNQAVMVHDTIKPSIACSAPIVVNASGPGGATVPYSVTATDNCSVASLTSTPPSGSIFPIGTTTVNGRATDIALPQANVSTCSFPVHVKGAVEQLQDLLLVVTGVGPGESLASKVQEALSNVQAGKVANACSGLAAFMHEVQAQSGKKLTTAQATSLLVDAARIRAVLGC